MNELDWLNSWANRLEEETSSMDAGMRYTFYLHCADVNALAHLVIRYCDLVLAQLKEMKP